MARFVRVLRAMPSVVTIGIQSGTYDAGEGGLMLVSGERGRYQVIRKMFFFRRDFPEFFNKSANNLINFRNSRLYFDSF